MSIISREAFYGDLDKKPSEVKLATIAPGYTEGRPHIVFDGEAEATLKTYPYLSQYTPVSGDRVMLVKGVVFGKII